MLSNTISNFTNKLSDDVSLLGEIMRKQKMINYPISEEFVLFIS